MPPATAGKMPAATGRGHCLVSIEPDEAFLLGLMDTPEFQAPRRVRRLGLIGYRVSEDGGCRGGDGLSHEQNQQVLEPNMKMTYDPEVDVLRIICRAAAIEESDEDKPGINLDYDAAGNVVGLEILNASQRVENPRSVQYAVA